MATSRNIGIGALEPGFSDELANVANSDSGAATPSVRDSLAAQLRAQYGGAGSGSGNWDDAGYDRAAELADLLINAGVTNLGDLSFKDVIGERWEAGMDDQGNPLPGQWIQDTPIGRQLMIGDKAVGYLGDYNNDGTFGNKADTVLQGVGDEALLGWSARGGGNTSYRVITDPATGKLVIAPGWNSSSDAADFRKAGIFLGGAALGGSGISGNLANLAGLSGTAGGAALSGAATGAGLNMATTQDVSSDTALAAALGGIGGYLGHVGGDLLKTALPDITGGADSLIGGGTDALVDAAGNTVPLNMAAIESGLGTPGYGFNAAASASGLFDPAVIGSGAGLMYGPGGTIISYDPAAVSAITANDPVTSTPNKPTNTKPASEWTEAEWDEYLNSSDPALSAPTNAPTSPASVDISGTRIPAEVLPAEVVNVGGIVGATLPTVIDVFNSPEPQTVEVTTRRDPPVEDTYRDEGLNYPPYVVNNPNYGNEGNNYPPSTNNPNYGNEGNNYPPSTNNPNYGNEGNNYKPPVVPPVDGDLIDTGDGDNVLDGDGNDTITNLPPGTGPGDIDITDLIPLIPLIPGVGGGGGTTPVTPGPSITATPPPSLGRRYIPPPPGYRPGFDPEHRYFTGIGAVGIGG